MKKIKQLLFAGILTAIMSLSVSATASAADIPSSAIVWNGHSYYLYKQTMKFAAAQEYCESLGGYLAEIDNAKENKMLTDYLEENGVAAAMIGLYDAAGSNGSWSSWSTGRPATYKNWGYKQPDWEGQTICVLNSTPNSYYGWDVGQWDNGWDGDYYFICEWDSTDKIDLKDATVQVSPEQYTYKVSSAMKPSVTVKIPVTKNGKTNTKKLKKNTDYTVSYANNKEPGIASVTVTGIGNYTGSNSQTFEILPRSPKSFSLKKSKSAKVTASWKPVTEAAYYELEYATSPKFENSKTVTTKSSGMTFDDAQNAFGNSKKTYTFTDLKPKTKYHIRIRSYKNGLYSKWVKKTVTTKK